MNPTFSQPRSAYIHVPFCAHRCGYCDFTLVANRDELIDRYLEALAIEIAGVDGPHEIDTLFFGGGTPTHLSEQQLERLFNLVRTHFRLNDDCEFSVEANPIDLDDGKIAMLADAGVNRVSLGVQSFDAATLRLLERDHRREEIERVIPRLQARFENISLDLIFAVPGQTLTLWRDTLQDAIALGPRHISTYGLTFEKGTAFWTRRRAGDLVAAPDELQREMYGLAMDQLQSAGYEQYEISNFASAGFRCRHNEVYWQGLPYFAFGPGAARYIAGRRETNYRSVTTWLQRVLNGQSAVAETDTLSPEDRAREALVIGLRLTEGIHRDRFQSLTGFDVDELSGETIARHRSAGLLEDIGSHVRLTREGRFLADIVVVDFL